MNEFWANVIVAIHLGYLVFVIAGMLAILLGMALRWQWIRNPWFRLTHMAMILVVALEAVAGITCPLTTWEEALRARDWEAVWEPLSTAKAIALLDTPLGLGPLVAASSVPECWFRLESQTFVGRCLRFIMFPDVPEQYLSMIYYLFALAVVASFLAAPPRFRRKPMAEAGSTS